MDIKEDLLHYVWQYQIFEKRDLKTTAGQRVQVLQPGKHNRGAGPDFAEASIVVDTLRWAGAVECHVRSADWATHGHSPDPAYARVVLHVVWQHNAEVYLPDGTLLPVLELRGLVSPALLARYHKLTHRLHPGPSCGLNLPAVPKVVVMAMQERALLERLELKATALEQQFELAGRDWEETTYQCLAHAWGMPYNGALFGQIAAALPLRVVKRLAHQPNSLEALFLGQAGLLAHAVSGAEPAWQVPFGQRAKHVSPLPKAPVDSHLELLHQEYAYQAGRLQLPPPLAKGLLATGRMRPAYQPALKLAQWAMLVAKTPPLFDTLCQAEDLETIVQLFRVQAGPFWANRYTLGPSGPTGTPRVGLGFALRLVANAVVPLLVAYGRQRNLPAFTYKALRLLEDMPAEHNHLTKPFTDQGAPNQDAAQSQGLMGLHKQYCQQSRCLQCQIGGHILAKQEAETFS